MSIDYSATSPEGIKTYMLSELKDEIKELKDVINGPNGLITKTALLSQAVEAINKYLDGRKAKDWTIISSLLLLVLNAGFKLIVH